MKTHLLLFLAMALSFGAYAQRRASWLSVSMGPYIGVNISRLVTDTPETQSMFKGFLGFTMGGFIQFKAGKFALQPELQYSLQGSRLKIPSMAGIPLDGLKVELSNAYLNIPLLLKYYPVDGLSIQLGPQFSYLTSTKMIIKSDLGGNKISLTDRFRRDNYAVNMGIGYAFPQGLTLDVRYNLGLNNIQKVRETGYGYLRDHTIQFTTGYVF